MSKISQIMEGWGNVIKDKFDLVDPEVKGLSEMRLLQCDPCPIRQGNTCSPSIYGYHIKTKKRVNGCGCNIAAKTLSVTSNCPIGKW